MEETEIQVNPLSETDLQTLREKLSDRKWRLNNLYFMKDEEETK